MKILKIVGKIMVPILLVLLIWLVVTEKKEQQEKQKILAKQVDYIREIERTTKQKEEEIQNLKEKRERTINNKVSITLCIDQMSPNLYDQVKPIFDSYNLKGVFVIENGMLPGSEGTITRQQYDQLIEEGWEAAIGTWDDLKLEREQDRKTWTERLDELIAQMKKENIDVPNSYYFKQNRDAKECEEILKQRDFQVVCRYEKADQFYGLEWKEDWNRVGIYQISQLNYDVEELFKELEEHKAAIVFSTRYIASIQSNDLDCQAASYRTVLEMIRSLQEEGRAEIVSLSKMYETRLNTYNDANREDPSYEDELEKMQKELQDLNEEWKEIFRGENPVNSQENEIEESKTGEETMTEEEETTKEADGKETTTKKESTTKNSSSTSIEESQTKKEPEKVDAVFSAE